MRSSKHKDREFYSEEGSKPSKRTKLEKGSYRPSKTLCVSQFSQRMSEDEIENMLHKEFRKFGEHNITFPRSTKSGKIAYVHFRYHEDALAIRSAHKNKSLDLDPTICIDLTEEFPGSKPSSPYTMSRPSEHYAPSPDASVSLKAGLRGDKFYQDDVEDKAATRTLFIGNLDHEITETELAEIFGRFGYIEDIDIKRGSQTHGSVYAFIRFHNLEMARRAKKEMVGQYIRKYQCRIGYGKHVPSNCLWVGSLGPWLAKEDLERCFSSFNPLRIEWSYGRSHAYLVFSSLEVATSVLNSMQGFEICPGHFIRLDYSDENHIAALMNPTREEVPKSLNKSTDQLSESKVVRSAPSIVNAVPSNVKQVLSEIQNVQALTKHLQVAWKGNLALKNITLQIKMHLLSGHNKIVDMLLKDSDPPETNCLKVSHELSLNHKKTNDFFAGILNSTFDSAIFIVVPDLKSDEDDEAAAKHFNMILGHLKRKNQCGLSFLPTGSTFEKCQGTLHLFPPFVHIKQLVRILCPKIIDLPGKDHLYAIINTVTIS